MRWFCINIITSYPRSHLNTKKINVRRPQQLVNFSNAYLRGARSQLSRANAPLFRAAHTPPYKCWPYHGCSLPSQLLEVRESTCEPCQAANAIKWQQTWGSPTYRLLQLEDKWSAPTRTNPARTLLWDLLRPFKLPWSIDLCDRESTGVPHQHAKIRDRNIYNNLDQATTTTR
jgi:hypothetical protein